MSSKTIKAFERRYRDSLRRHTEQGVTFRDARKPGLGPSSREATTLPPPPAVVQAAALRARASELENTARMMLERASELRQVAETFESNHIRECDACTQLIASFPCMYCGNTANERK